MKLKLIVYACLFITVQLNAQEKKEVVKRIVKATSELRNYRIEYEKHFKFQSGDDTTISIYNSEVHYTLGQSYTGWHDVKNITNPGYSYKTALNANAIVTLYPHDSLYYLYPYSISNSVGFVDRQTRDVYRVLSRNKKDYKDYVLKSDDGKRIILEENDSSTEKSLGLYIVSRALLTIDAKTYLPLEEERWSWFEGGVQYAKFIVHNIIALNGKTASMAEHKVDSMQRYFRQFYNGDSFWEARKEPLKPVKEGDSAYAFNAHFHDLDTFKWSDYKDSVLILDFFYTTCGPCAAAVPQLLNIHHKYKNKGVHLFGVNPMSGDWKRLDKFMGYYHIDYPVVETPQGIAKEYGIQGYPTLFIIKKGMIMKIHIGFSKDLEAMLEKELERLLKN